MSGRAAAVLLAAALVVAGCGGSGDDAPAGAPTTTARGSDETSTTTTSSTTTTAAAEACAELPAPVGAEETTTAAVDVDGDGGDDQLVAFRVGEDWHLRVEVAAGGAVDLAMEIRPGDGVEVIGGADVDGDGADELWARVGTGASATIVGLARFEDCALDLVRFEDGEPAELPVGGSVGSPAGLSCEGAPDLTAYAALLGDDDVYDVVVTPYTLSEGVLVAGAPTTTTVPADDQGVYRYASFACGGLTL